jgi:fibronectin-binding autotransporter adhesin
LGIEIGFGGKPLETGAILHLINTEATIDQYLLVGSACGGRLFLEESSIVNAPMAYVNVGQGGEGFLRVAQKSMLISKFLSVGVTNFGNVAIDSDGKATTQTGEIGVLADKQGTVNIEDGGIWDTKDLTVGQNGIGYVYVRNDGTLKITGMGVLGKSQGSRGVLNLIGADAHLDLGASGSLVIGDEGVGELNLSKMATFTSQGDVKLGGTATGSGTVTIDGADSKWTVDGSLSIGEVHFGRVEVTGGGTLRVQGGLLPLVVGGQTSGDGTLVISGAESKVEFDGQQDLIIGAFGKGLLEIRNRRLWIWAAAKKQSSSSAMAP